MIALVLIIILLLLAGIILTLMKNNQKTGAWKNLPVKPKPLLSNAELNFYHVMQLITAENKVINCKCRLEDLVSIDNCPERESFRNRIKSRHIDFVVFDPDNGHIEYAIELDDRSHKSEKAREADLLKDRIFEKINIPLIRIPAKRTYEPKEIKKILDGIASGSGKR